MSLEELVKKNWERLLLGVSVIAFVVFICSNFFMPSESERIMSEARWLCSEIETLLDKAPPDSTKLPDFEGHVQGNWQNSPELAETLASWIWNRQPDYEVRGTDPVEDIREPKILYPPELTVKPSVETITLTWRPLAMKNAVSHAGYEIYRKREDEIEFVKIASLSGEKRTYEDKSGILPMTNYEYYLEVIASDHPDLEGPNRVRTEVKQVRSVADVDFRLVGVSFLPKMANLLVEKEIDGKKESHSFWVRVEQMIGEVIYFGGRKLDLTTPYKLLDIYKRTEIRIRKVREPRFDDRGRPVSEEEVEVKEEVEITYAKIQDTRTNREIELKLEEAPRKAPKEKKDEKTEEEKKSEEPPIEPIEQPEKK